MSTCTSRPKRVWRVMIVSLLAVFMLAAASWSRSASAIEPAVNGKLETLAEHRVLARYMGAPYRICHGRTSRCPEHCGNSGEFATFDIVEYLHYDKPGKYGDAEQKKFAFQVSDFRRKPKGDAKMLEKVRELKEGDLVLLEWHHLYGEVRPGAFSPVRPVIELRRVTEKEAEQLRVEVK
jgi:hypothetical protein